MRRIFFALAAGLALIVTMPAAAAEPETEAANAAADYIIALQNPDGGFPAFGDESSPGATLDAVFALVAVDRNVFEVTSNGSSPVDYLETQAAAYAKDPGAAAKLAIGVAALGLDASDFAGFDLLALMEGSFDEETGIYGLDLFDEALYMLALAAAGEPVPEALFEHLRTRRAVDGGWEFAPGGGSDTNTTAIVAQALIAGGAADDEHAVGAALGYLHAAQNPDAGIGFVPDADTDPNSTALAIQALAAAGEDIDTGGRWEVDGATPLDALLSFQNPETGAFQFDATDSAFATYQAVPALMLAPFPDLQSRGDAPNAATASPTLEPGATATPLPALPDSGSGAGGSALPFAALVALAGAGAAALAAGRAARRAA